MGELRRRMEKDLVVRGMAVATQKSYLGAMEGLVRHYKRSPEELTEEEVQDYVVWMLEERGLSPNTCHVAANAFRFFYRVTLGRKEAEFVVPAPKLPRRLPEILSREEVSRILEAPGYRKHRVMLATTYAAGLRLGELVGLKVLDIDGDRMTVRVEQGKGGRDRYVPLSRRLLGRLRAYWEEERPRQWLFPGAGGEKPLHPSTAQRVYGRAKLRARVEKGGGIHSLRHAYATHLVEAGTDLYKIQRLLGHRHISTTMRYLHLAQGKVQEVVSPFDLLDRPED